MTACSWCHRLVGGEAERCQFPNSDVCRNELRKETEAHAINNSYAYVGQHRLGLQWSWYWHGGVPAFKVNLKGGAHG